MNFQFDLSGHIGVLTINGEISLEREDELKEILMVSMNSADYLIVNFEKTIEASISGIKLLCAAHRYCVKSNKRLTLTGKQIEAFKHLLKDSGYPNDEGCILHCKNHCLWTGGPNNVKNNFNS